MKKGSIKKGLFFLVIFALVFYVYGAWSLKRLTWTPGTSSWVDFAGFTDSDTLHIAYSDNTLGKAEIFFKKSTNGGTTWSSPVRITWSSGHSLYPSIDLDSSGILYIVYSDNTFGNYEIFFKKSEDGGSTWQPPRRLSWNSGISTYPKMAIDSNDNIHIVFQDNSAGNYEIIYKKSEDEGASWTTKRLTWTPGNSLEPAIAIDSKDNIYIVWEDHSPGNREIFYKKSSDGGSTWSPPKRLTWSPSHSFSPKIAIDSNDYLHVVWYNYDYVGSNYEIFYKRSTDGGATWTTKRLTWTPGNSTHPDIIVHNNRIHVVFCDFATNTSSNEIFHKISTDGGDTWTLERLTWNSGDSGYPVVHGYTVERMVEGHLQTVPVIGVAWRDKTPGNYEIFFKHN